MSRPALAADRALQVLDLLALHPTERFSLTEIARRAQINPASAHALLAVLLRGGYVQRHPSHKTYALGPALVAASTAALEQLPGVQAALGEIDALSRELQLETLVTSPTEGEIIVVGRARLESAYGTVIQVGQRLPLAPPLGSVFLAWSPAPEIDRWLARARPALDADEIEQQRLVLDVVRTRGYSIAFDSEARRGLGEALRHQAGDTQPSAPGAVDELLAELAHSAYHLTTVDDARTYDVSMVAAPVFDANQRVTAAFAVSGFAPGLPASDLLHVGERLRGIALVVTKRTHGRLPPELM